MRVEKTEKGREVMTEKTVRLNLRARQVLIVADGKRTADEICKLLGDDVREIMVQLGEQGLLQGMDVLQSDELAA